MEYTPYLIHRDHGFRTLSPSYQQISSNKKTGARSNPSWCDCILFAVQRLPAIARAALITASRAEVVRVPVASVGVMMQAPGTNAWPEIDTARTLNTYRSEEATSTSVTGSRVVAEADADSAPRWDHPNVRFGFL